MTTLLVLLLIYLVVIVIDIKLIPKLDLPVPKIDEELESFSAMIGCLIFIPILHLALIYLYVVKKYSDGG